MQEFPAYDDLIQGVSGTASLNAGPDGAPRYFPTVRGRQADRRYAGLDDRHGAVPSGAHRAGTGNPPADDGDDCVLHCWSNISGMACLGEPEKGLGYPRMLTPHRRPYQTKDGYISVIAHSDAQWNKLFEAMGVPH